MAKKKAKVKTDADDFTNGGISVEVEESDPPVNMVVVTRKDKGEIEIPESELERYKKSDWKLV